MASSPANARNARFLCRRAPDPRTGPRARRRPGPVSSTHRPTRSDARSNSRASEQGSAVAAATIAAACSTESSPCRNASFVAPSSSSFAAVRIVSSARPAVVPATRARYPAALRSVPDRPRARAFHPPRRQRQARIREAPQACEHLHRTTRLGRRPRIRLEHGEPPGQHVRERDDLRNPEIVNIHRLERQRNHHEH